MLSSVHHPDRRHRDPVRQSDRERLQRRRRHLRKRRILGDPLSWAGAGGSQPLLVLWNNCETSIMAECLAYASGNETLYTPRNLLHGAISTDEGVTFRGHREVYRDPLMQAPPPVRGDRGVGYPNAVEQADGSVLVATGQGVGRWGLSDR